VAGQPSIRTIGLWKRPRSPCAVANGRCGAICGGGGSGCPVRGTAQTMHEHAPWIKREAPLVTT
jgi:hypothetical protein